METTIIPFPLHARLRAANDNGPDGPGGGAVSARLYALFTQTLALHKTNQNDLAQAA